jgi:hypothetical protein
VAGTRVLNTKEGISSRSQSRMRRPFSTVSETRMPACRIACPSPLRDAKLQMALHLCRQVSRNVSKEQTGRMLRSSHECQAKYVRKGGRKAMKSDGKRRGMGWASVTGKTLIPRETPMRTLSSGLSLWRLALLFLLPLQRSRRQHDGL